MFGTQGANDSDRMSIPQFITVGPRELRIASFEAVRTRNKEKFKIIANLETKPIGGDFTGFEDAKGQVGRVDLSIYTNGSDGYEKAAMDRIAVMANAMGIRAEVDAIRESDVDKYLKVLSKVFKDRYAWFLIGAEQYVGKDKEGNDKVKDKIRLPRYNYIAATESELKEKQTGQEWPTMDEDWFYKRIEAEMDEEPQGENPNGITPPPGAPEAEGLETDDLPF